jgi:Gas vesicle synthesis protein GvpL/GvpF
VILYLYAIAEGLDWADNLAGVGGETLACLVVDGVDVVVGEIDAAPGVDEVTLARQDQIVRQLHARATALLPMRFGAAFRSDAEMRQALTLRLPALRERLAIVRNAEQMTLRVFGRSAPTPDAPGTQDAPGAGAEYLRARAARVVPAAIVPLLEALRPLARDTRVEPGKTPGMIATLYQLIDRRTSAAYKAAVTAAAGTRPDLSVRVSGPSPCYAFT